VFESHLISREIPATREFVVRWIAMSRAFLGAVLVSLTLAAVGSAAQFEVTQDADGVTVKADGKLVTRYVIKSGPKPILWPLLSPSGKELTRGYPMRSALPFEAQDHVHQRSLWFTHGNVNGVDFWSENDKHGDIVHREFVKVSGGPCAAIVTRNDWIGPDGKKVCEDERSFIFGANDRVRWIDADLRVKATEGPVTFGDTKEGTFATRVWETIKVDAKKGGKIVNSDGLTDSAAWGKRAAWVDYYGPAEDQTAGIAILNHPSSYGFPSHWHVRTYGLFAANPFGLREFDGPSSADGAHRIEAGGEMLLRYRVVLHDGTTETAGIAGIYEEYAKSP
jgi:hypothetical protein